MASEASIENYVCRIAERHGWIVRKVSWLGRRGAPDRVFLGHGRCVFIEFKKPGEVPEGQQLREIERMQDAYAEVYWTDNADRAFEILGIAA